MCNRKLFFLLLNQNICCGYSKELSQRDGSFEHPKHLFIRMGKKIITILRFFFCLTGLCVPHHPNPSNGTHKDVFSKLFIDYQISPDHQLEESILQKFSTYSSSYLLEYRPCGLSMCLTVKASLFLSCSNVKYHNRLRLICLRWNWTECDHKSEEKTTSLALKAPRKMHLKMLSAEVVCCK